MSAKRGRQRALSLVQRVAERYSRGLVPYVCSLKRFPDTSHALLSRGYHATMCGLRDTWCAGAFEACSRDVHAEISSSAVARGTSYGLCDSWIDHSWIIRPSDISAPLAASGSVPLRGM